MALRDHLEKLVTFEAVCRLKSFSFAAQELRISQPAVSKAISKLETEREVQLLVRTKSGVIPTSAGCDLLKLAEEILTAVKTFEASRKKRIVRIGTKEPLAVHFLADFLTEHSDVAIDLIVERSNNELIARLAKGDLDLLVVPESKFPPAVKRSLLFESRWAAFRNPKGNRRGFIVFSETIVGNGKLRDFIGKRTDEITVQSLETAMAMAVKGAGKAILPQWMAREQMAKGNLIETEISSGIPSSKICAVYRRAELPIRQTVARIKEYCIAVNLST